MKRKEEILLFKALEAITENQEELARVICHEENKIKIIIKKFRLEDKTDELNSQIKNE